MTIFAYVSKRCEDDARAHAVTDAVERMRSQVEASQSLSSFDPFPPPYLVRKKLQSRQRRLIAETRSVGDHVVVVFLAVMIRGAREYESEFAQDPRGYGRQHFDGMVGDDVLAAFVADRTADAVQAGKPPASEPEYALLYDTFSLSRTPAPQANAATDAMDRIVCESHAWVQQTTVPAIQQQLNRLAACCVHALSAEPGLRFIAATERPGWGVWTYRHEGHVLLIQVVDGANATEAQDEARRVGALIDRGGSDALLQCSRRAYPASVLTDEQLWLDLERETLANMALSPEETAVLESARHSPRPFPLFINGRAGSGKSTILQYLFTDILRTYCHLAQAGVGGPAVEQAPLGVPLYLTANGDLLAVARQFVGRLLRSQQRFDVDAGDAARLDEASVDDVLQRAFREFRPFMLDLLKPEDRARFAASRRIDYPRFRRMWEQRFGKDPKARREHGPDVAWHVIRSYIKGMGSEDFLEPDDYAQLPDNQLSVSTDTFAAVHSQVWLAWYQPLMDDGDWDDQDLARHILDNDCAPRSHSAVFCDEAQDFTRIELEVLLRLSLYSDRALNAADVDRVPFAFAGDEFQTLNPTGFRWDAVKASFVEKFIFELDPGRRGDKADLNYRELRFNYRSATPIVRYSNLVQALRAATFDIPELRPQRPWLLESTRSPVLHFRQDDAAFWAELRKQAAVYVVIVPCSEGEEADYVARDPVLREHIEVVDGVPQNVLSAGRAKGCEYERVVVYGFGADLDVDLNSTIGSPNGVPPGVRSSLSVQYFVNRVYVAVSRAKQQLVIVDTEAGAARLWKVARDEFARERLIGTLKRGQEVWAPEVGGSMAGKADDLRGDEAPDRLQNAKVFRSDGIARRDPYLMMQAAGLFKEAGDTAMWRECRARALDFGENWFEAGVAYVEAGYLDEARRCLWRGDRNGWLKLREIAAQHPELLSHLELQFAKAILDKADAAGTGGALTRLIERIQQDAAFALASCTDPSWRLAVDLLARALLPETVDLKPAVAKGILMSLDTLARLGLPVANDLTADLAFRSEDFARAAAHWESIGERRSPRYLAAKAQSTPFPASLEYLKRPGDGRRIVAAFDASPASTVLDAQQANAVVSALLEAERPADALALAEWAQARDGAMATSLHAVQRDDVRLALRALHVGFRLAFEQADWEAWRRFINNGEVLGDAGWRDKAAKAWVKAQAPDIRLELVRALARAERPLEVPPAVDDTLGQFLRDVLLGKADKWLQRLDWLEAGAALERAGRIIDGLKFYEEAMEARLGGELLHRVRLRWLAVKGRQLEYARARKNPDNDAIRRIETDLQQKMQAWQVTRAEIQQLSRYPELEERPTTAPSAVLPVVAAQDDLSQDRPAMALPPGDLAPIAQAARLQVPATRPAATATPSTSLPVDANTVPGPVSASAPAAWPVLTDVAGDVQLSVGVYRVDVRRALQLCTVTHSAELDMVKIDWGRMRVTGTVDLQSEGAAAWSVEPWDLRIELEAGNPPRVLLSLDGLGVALHIAG